ncbi:hypothetical protein OX284_006855 [Flavobacterium sp. SUN046]|uniref:hypothetical protein n=1 Tax=Flavobacterium sp. SUN046 TaxID=3002440 RepID=UPI002DB9EE0A|nr:hypothetical protein [Flavobacterium sp. SUN046]MEC4049143.1 hypothetical protein [Flavobacterium sp. SUN046]
MDFFDDFFFINIEQQISTHLNIAPDRAEGINQALILLNNKIEHLHDWLKNNSIDDIDKEIQIF